MGYQKVVGVEAGIIRIRLHGLQQAEPDFRHLDRISARFCETPCIAPSVGNLFLVFPEWQEILLLEYPVEECLCLVHPSALYLPYELRGELERDICILYHRLCDFLPAQFNLVVSLHHKIILWRLLQWSF